eukprot:GGOE01001660.1.p1 GENE.GGOE01001660.1~~GGOE01001660.1.p1  ORF type:complete len:651 (+),score=185.57 GGOE01001660.1:142-1953(+)
MARFYEEQQLAKGETLRRVEEEREAQFVRDCPFKPVINKFETGRRHEGCQKDTFARLSRSKEDMYRQLAEEKLKQTEKELEECSFRPETNKGYASNRRPRPGSATQLHLEAVERQLLMRQKREEEEEEERKDWFRPHINAMSRATVEAEPRPPIYQRVDELQRQKQILLHQLRSQELQKEEAAFKPQINQTSVEIVQLRQSAMSSSDPTGPFDDKLTQPSSAKAKLQEQAVQQHVRECTFQPKLSQKTNDIVQQHAAFKSQGFNERQMLFARRSKNKLHNAAQKVVEQEDATFQPELSPATVMIVEAKREAESIEERVLRLSIQDKSRAEETKKQAKEEYYSQFTFKPKLNKVSLALASTSESCDVTRAKTGHVTEELRQELEEEFRKECTFKPAITIPGVHQSLNASRVSGAPMPMLDLTEKERRLAEARREQQYEELKDCTFQPQVKRKVPNFAEKQVPIPGMAKYLDRRMQARQMDEERRAREEEVFKVRGVKPGLRYTVPQPFNLHTAYHSITKKEKTEAQLKAKACQTCTFVPTTNSKAAYDILRRYIMQDDPESEEEDARCFVHSQLPWANQYQTQASSDPLEVVDLEGAGPIFTTH